MFLTSEATEAAFDFESIKSMMDGFDPAALLPEVDGIVGAVRWVCQIAILVGPVVLLLMGLAYLLLVPKEANYYFGYRTAFGMGSVSAWRHTQKVAGCVFGGLGLILSVLMVMIATTFGTMEAMDMVWRAVACLLWEAGLTLAAVLTINSIAMFTYSYRGDKRRMKHRH